MTPFRTGLPKPPRLEMLERPRILETLDGRFDRRLTVLQAGAGFGKTTALIQAIHRNLEEGYGLDVWVGCRARDDRRPEFLGAVALALEARIDPSDLVRAIVDAIWKESPRDVALILDDAHHLRAEGESADALDELLREMPDNGHLVLATRESPPIRTSRLLAQGEVAVLSAEDLAFQGEERTAFFAMRNQSLPTGELAGWPALCELAATSGADHVGSFLFEEVVDALDQRTRRDLARVLAFDWVDAGRIQAATGERREPRDFFRDLPLHRIDAKGNGSLHGLWELALESVDPAWNEEVVDRVCSFLLESDEVEEALGLLLDHGSRRQLENLVTHVSHRAASRLTTEVLDGFIDRIPLDLRSAPVGTLLEARLRARFDPIEAKQLYEKALAGFQDDPSPELETAALAGLTNVAFSQFDEPSLEGVIERGRQIGSKASASMAQMSEAALLYSRRQHREALAKIDEVRSHGVPLGGGDATIAALAWLQEGVPERALEEVDRARPVALRAELPLLMANRFDALWLLGRVKAENLMRFDLPPGEPEGPTTNHTTGFHGVLAFQNAVLGRREQANLHLSRSSSALEVANQADAPVALLAARIAVAAEAGDDTRVNELVEAGWSSLGADRMSSRFFLRCLPIAMLRSTWIRDRFANRSLGPVYDRGRSAAAAILAFRSDRDLGPAKALPWEELQALRVFLVPRDYLELCILGAACGSSEAESEARALSGEQRALLRQLSEATEDPTAPLAGQLLLEVPAKPSVHWELAVLGPTQLLRNGEVVQDPTLRRDRVRAILEYLAAHPRARRRELAHALWPELDDAAGRNNLRVNLTHLGRLLEPDRQAGEPSFFFGEEQDLLRIEAGGVIRDLDRFEHHLDSAEHADQIGSPDRTLRFYEKGLPLYRGDFLQDAKESTWGAAERTRLRGRFARGALRAASLWMAVGRFDAATEAIDRVQVFDPLNEKALQMEVMLYLRREERSLARTVMESGLARLAQEGLPPTSELRRLAFRLGLPA